MAGLTESRTWDALLTSTMADYSGKLRDNVFDELPFLSWMNGKLADALRGERRLELSDGGETIVEHLLYEKATSTVKKYSKYELLNVVPQDGMTIARYSWRLIAGVPTISGEEFRNNSASETRMLDLWKAKVMQVEETLRDQLSQDFWGSNADGKSVDGLGLVLSTSATLGGLSPTTFTWWVPGAVTSTGSFAANGLKYMRTLFNTLSYGNNVPDGIFTDQTTFEYFENSLQGLERYSNTMKANAGFESLTFKGKPLFFDRDCTGGELVMLNSRNLKLKVHRDANLTPGKVVDRDDQDALSMKILWQGNLVVNERRKHGKLTGITA